jgi:hypothetical protein
MQGMLEELRDLFRTSVARPQMALGRKGKGRGNSFLFSENIFVKNKII